MRTRDAGAATVEFVLVAPLILLLTLATVQLTLALYVRNTLINAATEAARLAATTDATPAQAVALARGVLSQQLAGGVVVAVAVTTTRQGALTFELVQLRAKLPMIGLIGPASLVVSGHALKES